MLLRMPVEFLLHFFLLKEAVGRDLRQITLLPGSPERGAVNWAPSLGLTDQTVTTTAQLPLHRQLSRFQEQGIL